MLKKLERLLGEHGYHGLETDVVGISGNYKITEGEYRVVNMIDYASGAVRDEALFLEMEKETRLLLKQKGYPRGAILTIILVDVTDFAEAADCFYFDLGHWFIDKDRLKVLREEKQPADFYGLKKILENFLAGEQRRRMMHLQKTNPIVEVMQDRIERIVPVIEPVAEQKKAVQESIPLENGALGELTRQEELYGLQQKLDYLAEHDQNRIQEELALHAEQERQELLRLQEAAAEQARQQLRMQEMAAQNAAKEREAQKHREAVQRTQRAEQERQLAAQQEAAANANENQEVAGVRKVHFPFLSFALCFVMIFAESARLFRAYLPAVVGNVLDYGVLIPSRVANDGEVYRVFLSLLLPDNAISALGCTVILLIAGIALEQRIGTVKCFIICLLSGIYSNFFFAYYNVFARKDTHAAGTSAMIFGLAGACIIQFLFFLWKEWREEGGSSFKRVTQVFAVALCMVLCFRDNMLANIVGFVMGIFVCLIIEVACFITRELKSKRAVKKFKVGLFKKEKGHVLNIDW